MRDFFRPVEGSNFCEMLTSYNKHQWSADGETWVDVVFHSYSGHCGGSALWWPRDNGRAGDERERLSFWGHDGSLTGGCCSSSTAVEKTNPSLPGNSYTWWGQPFTLNYFSDLQPLPPNTGMSLVVAVPGTTVADDAFWAEPCKLIPSTARGITVDTGAVSVVCACSLCVRARVQTATSCPLTQDITACFYSACARTLDNNGFVSRVSCRGVVLHSCMCNIQTLDDVLAPLKCCHVPTTPTDVIAGNKKVRDFFRPVEGSNFCEMLTSVDKHQWSADGKTWVTVGFNSYTGLNGGSADGWPRGNGRAGDERTHLSFWGKDGSHTGGCCSSSTAVASTHPSLHGNDGGTQWGQPFTLNYFSDLQPLPPNTGMSLVADVAGTTLANDAYWAEQCKKIPSTARGIVVDMGAVSGVLRAIFLNHPSHFSCPSASTLTFSNKKARSINLKCYLFLFL